MTGLLCFHGSKSAQTQFRAVWTIRMSAEVNECARAARPPHTPKMLMIVPCFKCCVVGGGSVRCSVVNGGCDLNLHLYLNLHLCLPLVAWHKVCGCLQIYRLTRPQYSWGAGCSARAGARCHWPHYMQYKRTARCYSPHCSTLTLATRGWGLCGEKPFLSTVALLCGQ